MGLFSKKIRSSYSLEGVYKGHFNVHYKNVRAIKCPFDYVLYQMLISKLQPDLIVEIGTNEGGSALYLADLLALNGGGMVHTIDIATNKENPALHQHPNIRVFKDGYAGYDTILLKNFRKILVIEDGPHFYEDTLAVLKKFSPFVQKDSYIIVEDGVIDDLGKKEEYHGGPVKAISEFLQSNKQFIIDRTYCDFFGRSATFNTNGYLKRIS